MHEVGLVEQAIQTAVAAAQAAGGQPIERLTFAITPDGHVTREAVETLFAALSVGTPAAHARLEFEELEPEFGCWSCGCTFSGDARQGPPNCPKCRGRSVSPRTAAELVLKYIDVADAAQVDEPKAGASSGA